AVERPDLEGDHHPERDRHQHHRDARDLGDEPALPQVLLPPVLDAIALAQALQTDGEHVPGLTNDGVDLVRHLSRPPRALPASHSGPTAALLARLSHERRCRPRSPPQQTSPHPARPTLRTYCA